MLPRDDDALLAQAGFEAGGAADAPLFAESSWLRRVSGEPVLLFGGARALLLEIAHPLVAAGVAEHSEFRRDPFGRLQRTLDALSAITFGERAKALAAARRVERAHARVQGRLARAVGPFAAGTPYSGRDPAAMAWVWATLVDTSVAVYARFVAPLEAAPLEAYYADHRRLARLLGIPEPQLPRDWRAFRTWFDGMLDGEVLTPGAEACEIAHSVLAPPGGPPLAGVVRLLTAALLPQRLRDAYGLPWDAAREARLAQLTASVLVLRRPPDAAGALDARPEAG